MQITQTGDITPALLSELLTSCGVLRGGAATAVTLDMESAQMGFVSNVATFSVTYSDGAGPGAPRRLFLKITKPELHPEYRAAGAHEVTFYRDILATMHDLPVAACYYAEWDAAARRAVLLLDDLSQSHFQRPIPVAPPLLQCERIVESLAHIHARWWRHPQLGSTIGAPLQAAEAEASIERLHAGFAPFLDYLGDALLPAQREAYERILASSFLPRRARRLQALERVTLIHGDAHTNNIMLPTDTLHGRAILIDLHRWSIDVPAYDLAFLMALHWSAERRQAFEHGLVRRYHASLLQHGVADYTWEECWMDYRECVIVMALIPIGQLRRGMPPGVIWYGMEQSVAAFNDLGCADLL
jgi:hypothetical protein